MTRILYGGALAQASLGEQLEIIGDEQHYLRKVRRHQVADVVLLQGKDGVIFEAEITAFNKTSATVQLLRQSDGVVAPLPVHVLSAVPKGKVLDDGVRQLNELGVEKFTPVICERSSVVPGDQRVERWRRIAQQSMRQCRRSVPLEVAAPMSFKEAIAVAAEHRFMLHPENGAAAGELFGRRKPGSIAMLVGPEGGFTSLEVKTASDAGFLPLTLGKTILRIETALIVAAVTCVTLVGGFD